MRELETRLASFPARRIRIGASQLSYREGDKATAPCEIGAPALVCLHGIGSDSASWLFQLEGLADCCGMIAWDAPGYGGSTPLAQDAPEPADYARALARLLEELGIDRFYLVGHSLGALIAGAYAGTYGERLLGLVLVDPALGHGDVPLAERDARRLHRLAEFDRLGAADHAAARAPKLLADAAANPLALSLIERSMRNLDRAGYAQAAAMLAAGRLEQDVSQYGGPVFVISGEKDIITPPEGARGLADRFPNACYREISGAGHASYLERPDVFNALLREACGIAEGRIGAAGDRQQRGAG